MIPQVIAAARSIAQADTEPGFLDLKTILLVAVTLALIVVTRKLLGIHKRLEVLETAAPFPSSENNSAQKNGIAPETVAAISAAVHTTLSGRHRILSIGETYSNRQAWSVEGRRQVFQSHKVR